MDNINSKAQLIQELAKTHNVEIQTVGNLTEGSNFYKPYYDTNVIIEQRDDLVIDYGKLIKDLDPQFFASEFVGIPIKMVEAINENRIDTTPWKVQLGNAVYYGVTFQGEVQKPKSLREAFDNCITEYIPPYRAIINTTGITFILTKKERDDLILAVDNAMKL